MSKKSNQLHGGGNLTFVTIDRCIEIPSKGCKTVYPPLSSVVARPFQDWFWCGHFLQRGFENCIGRVLKFNAWINFIISCVSIAGDWHPNKVVPGLGAWRWGWPVWLHHEAWRWAGGRPSQKIFSPGNFCCLLFHNFNCVFSTRLSLLSSTVTSSTLSIGI